MTVDVILQAAEAKRSERQSKLDELIKAPTDEKRELTAEEQASFEKLVKRIQKSDEQIAALKAEAERVKAAETDAANPGGSDGSELRDAPVVVRSQMTYNKWNHRNSYLKDLAVTAVAAQRIGGTEDDPDQAIERLRQSQKELDIEARTDKRVADILNRFKTEKTSGPEQRANPNTSYGYGGEFVPPLWLIDQYVPYLRPARNFANRVSNQTLPGGTDLIELPKIVVGSQVGVQYAQGGAVTSQDIQTATVSAKVNTLAGEEDIAMQLLEQSPIAMDGVVFMDLQSAYDALLDQQLIYGTGSAGQHLGVLNVPGATSNQSITNSNYVTVSSASFIGASGTGAQYNSIVNGVNQIETLRLAAPTGILAHPRRVNSWALGLDSQNRPLFTPSKYGQYNQVGTAEGSPIPQAVAGEMFGLPVIKDANVPITMNGTTVGGGSADPVVVLKEDDLILWEGTLRLRALPEILSGTLQIRYQLYCYSAFMPNRFPPSISILTGNTGLATPGF